MNEPYLQITFSLAGPHVFLSIFPSLLVGDQHQLPRRSPQGLQALTLCLSSRLISAVGLPRSPEPNQGLIQHNTLF